jgi:hypothetical protein
MITRAGVHHLARRRVLSCMLRYLLLVVAAGCVRSPAASPQVPPPLVRATRIIDAWSHAFEHRDDAAVRASEDGYGRFAIAYVIAKMVAAELHPDGGEAVRSTVGSNLLIDVLWPDRSSDYFVVMPSGPLGPALVAAGLAEPWGKDASQFTVTAIPKQHTVDRMQEAEAAYRERLRERAPWRCRDPRILATVPRDEPLLLRAAAESKLAFGLWHEELEAIWLVEAACAGGPTLFAITAGRHPRRGTSDRVLLVQ